MSGKRESQSQRDRFIEAARELGCEEDEERFNATLKRVANAPPPKDDKAKKDKPGQ